MIAELEELTLVTRARAFGRWWLAELAALVPSRFKPGAKAPHADIRFFPDRVEVVRVDGEEGVRLVDPRPIETLDSDAWAELAGIVDATRARIILEAPDIYVTKVRLPTAARAKFRSAIALQLESLAPLDPALIVWNCVLAELVPDGVVVELAMARQARIARISELFAAADAPMPPIHAATARGTIELAAGHVGARSPDAARNRLALMVAAGLLISIPLTTIIVARASTWARQSSIELLQRQVIPKLAAQRRVRDTEELKALLRPVAARPTITSLVADLAAHIPESGYVRVAKGTGRSVTIVVDTQQSEALAAALGRADSLKKLRIEDQTPGEPGHVIVSLSGSSR